MSSHVDRSLRFEADGASDLTHHSVGELLTMRQAIRRAA
jgi:hypothetical protein